MYHQCYIHPAGVDILLVKATLFGGLSNEMSVHIHVIHVEQYNYRQDYTSKRNVK